MVYMIFQYGCEPFLIQRKLVGFEAILENIFFYVFKDNESELRRGGDDFKGGEGGKILEIMPFC